MKKDFVCEQRASCLGLTGGEQKPCTGYATRGSSRSASKGIGEKPVSNLREVDEQG